MKNNAYWEDRQAQRMFEYMEDAEKAADEISKIYIKASRYLDLSIDDIYEKYRDKYGLSEDEAQKLLQTLPDDATIQELKRVLENDPKNKNKQELLKKLESPAYEFRIRRLQELRNRLDTVMENVYQQEKIASDSHYITQAGDAYYKSVFDVQQYTGLGFAPPAVTAKVIERVVNSKWSGKNYSERIWSNTGKLASTIKKELLLGLITGKTNKEVAKDIEIKFASGASNARRLVRTESNYLCNQMQKESYEKLEIEEYRFLATLDLRTSAICRSLDGVVKKLTEAVVGENYPPMHPWCRSTIISIIDDNVLSKLKRKALDPKTGKMIDVPANMTYEEWYKKYVEMNPDAKLEEKKIQKRSSDRKQYAQYKKVLGKDIPKTLDDFQNMKYTKVETWKELQKHYRTVNQYEIVSGKMRVTDILRLDQKYAEESAQFNSRYRSQGNIAIAEYDGKDYIAHSKIKNDISTGYKNYKGKMTFVFEQESKVFKTQVIPKDTGWDRKVDSEAKLFEYIHTIVEEEHSVLNIMTKLPMCDSCLDVFEQFKTLHPNISVNIIQRKVVK